MANVSSSNGIEKHPKLRFPEFTEPWETTQLCNLFSKNTQKNAKGTVTNVISNSAKNGLIPQKDYFDKDIANADNTAGYYIISKNDFVYNPRKSTDAPYGPISRYTYEDDGIVSPLYLCFKGNKEINPDYFEKYFKSSAWHRYIYMSGDSGARHDRVSIKDETFFEMPIHIPCNDEQKKIAFFLSALEHKIEKQAALVHNLKKYKRGVEASFFYIKQHACENENQGLVRVPLGNIVTINPKTPALPEHFIYIDLESVDSGRLQTLKHINRENAPSRAQHVLADGDVLFQMVRPYQKNNYYFRDIFDSPVVASTGYAQIRCQKCDPVFVFEQISSDYFSQEAMLRSTGTGYPAINSDGLAEIPFFLPPLSEQKRIGKFLSLLSSKTESEKRKLDIFYSLKAALLQQLFI